MRICTSNFQRTKRDIYLLDIIPSREEKILDKIIIKETKGELANQLNCTQGCIVKKQNKILNLIKKNTKY